ncbi:hydrolase [Aureococcus anophagefferens]|nr:hydrolase [Aureococcus anophagefferens]
MAPWPTCETGPLEASDADCFALSSARVVLPCDAECLFEVVPATVVVVRGVIAAVFRPGDAVALPRAASCRKTTAPDLARSSRRSRRRRRRPVAPPAQRRPAHDGGARGVVAVPAAGPGTREDAQSPLMLLPFCQVDDDDDGGGAAAADAAPPPDDDDWAAPRGPAAATLRAGAAKDRSPDTPATPGGWTRPSRPPPVAVARLGGAAASPAESHCSTPTRRAAPPSEFFRSPKNESEGGRARRSGSPGERSPRSGYDSPPRSQKRDRSDPFGEKEEGTWVKNLLQAELESYQMSGSATTSEPASGPSTARSPRGGASLLDQGERRSSPPDGGPTSPRLRRVKALAAAAPLRRWVAADPAELLGNLVAEHGRTATPVLEPDASLRPAPGGRSPPQVAAPPPPPPDGRRMSFLDLDARRASPPERRSASRTRGGRRRSRSSRRTTATRGAIRKEYSLYCDGHPSAAGAIGLEAALDAAASLDDGGGASACGLSLHVAKVSTLQTARVLHDAQAHEDACAAAGTRRLFGDLSGSVALYHLTHCEEAVPHGATVHKNGTVAVVTSGHAPGDPRASCGRAATSCGRPTARSRGQRAAAAVLWSAARTNGYGLGALAVWLSFGPAKLLNLASDRGLIDVGFRADFVIFDADRDWTVDASKLQGVDGDVLDGIPEKKREKRLAAACLFHGHECSGKVLATLLRGRLTYREGRFRTAPHGEVVAR